ncbi:MAG: polyhydroxyalkanoate synthesis regulator DNA-binding domain-containing protein [Desulfosalsimonadaceae bacterium]|nr:polyhydroxyalkanoate synthesis regulator DNA-binding domain-containing protein [Desulfosalsimonadaceae bacterium]
MYTIKKYANGRFYDTVEKNYITRAQISDLVKAKKKIDIIDTRTGADITSEVLSKAPSKDQKDAKAKPAKKAKSRKSGQDSANFLVQLFRKGEDALSDFGKKGASMWQDILTTSKEEIEKVINLLVKDNKISEFEAKKLKDEVLKFKDNVQNWVSKHIDGRINEVLDKMNLANRDQVVELTAKINALNSKIAKLEKSKAAAKPAKTEPAKPAPAKPAASKEEK